MAAVVFSKVCVATGLPKVISRYCYYTPGFRGIANADCQVVPRHLFKKTLQAHAEGWETANRHPELNRGESPLWTSFFNRQLRGSQATNMAIQRFDDPDHSFEAEIIGDLESVESALGIHIQDTDILTSHFQAVKNRLKERGLAVKPKVAVSIESKLALPIQFECDTGLLYTHYVENNKPSFKLWSIDPLVPMLYSLAPIVKKVQQAVSFGNGSLVHTFSEVYEPVSQQLASKPTVEATV